MRRLFVSLLVVTAVAALLVVGTAAYFSYTATASSGNMVQTAKLNLVFDPQENIPMNASNLIPGESTAWSEIWVENDSEVPVFFYVNAANLQGDLSDKVFIEVIDAGAGENPIFKDYLCNFISPVLASAAADWAADPKGDGSVPANMIPPHASQWLKYRITYPEFGWPQNDGQDKTQLFDLQITATTAEMY